MYIKFQLQPTSKVHHPSTRRSESLRETLSRYQADELNLICISLSDITLIYPSSALTRLELPRSSSSTRVLHLRRTSTPSFTSERDLSWHQFASASFKLRTYQRNCGHSLIARQDLPCCHSSSSVFPLHHTPASRQTVNSDGS